MNIFSVIMEKLSNIFTKTNLRIIELLSKGKLHIREIASHIGCSPAKVHEAVALFKEHGIIREIKDKNKSIIVLNLDSHLLKKIIEVMESEGVQLTQKESLNLFDSISPLDFRYYGRNKQVFEKLQPYLSESAFIRYAAKVESALALVLAKRKICSVHDAEEIEKAARLVSAEEVYAEEDKIKHNMRALANSIRNKVGDRAKPFVHFTTTSYYIIASADAARYKDFTNNVLLPELVNFERTLIGIALREKDTIQIGRTHGQHAEPITFGFAMANYVSRLGNRIISIKKTGDNLRGKISGAVGSYNASSLFFPDAEDFEREVLSEIGLKPSPTSTQISEPEFLVDYLNSIVSCFGVIADLADDMRHLQRSEIAEIGEFFDAKQVGSSTMPQKKNPINFENVKSLWKEFMPRITTMYMDQLSEHQRDLTNSASMRFIPEILAGIYVSITRLNNVMSKISVDKSNMTANFSRNKGLIAAEPLYIMLAALGHPDAHEYVREMTIKSQKSGRDLIEMVMKDDSVNLYIKRMNKKQ